jgi:hypothetical protein
MSYNELQSIREQGVDGIVNLCGEYADLHQIEKSYGFEVYYLPVEDDQAPALRELEKALDWLDESLYLGKKVLVHCTHGIGRTGTFVTSYLMRRGFSLKLAKQKLKKTRAEFLAFTSGGSCENSGKKRAPSVYGNPPSKEATWLTWDPILLNTKALFMTWKPLLTPVIEISRAAVRIRIPAAPVSSTSNSWKRLS